MPFLMPVCLICLKSENDLNVINKEMITKLRYCVEKIEDLILSITSQIKICNDCLNKLNTAFDFKKMCVNNIPHIKDYITQLEQVPSNIDELKESEDLSLEQHLNEKTGSKEEASNKICYENYRNNKSEEVCLDKELKLLLRNEEIIASRVKLQNELTKVYNVNPMNESAYLLQEQPLDEQIEKVFVKSEVLDEIDFQTAETSESQQRSNEKLRLLLHKEEILEPDYSQKLFKIVKTESKKKFSCSVCTKTFIQKGSLTKHMLIHSNERTSYSCLICKNLFTQKSYLDKHMLIHSTERPYSCSVCMKSFNRKNYLSQHMLIHLNKQSYSCSVCLKTFNLRNSFDKHMLIHSQRSHSCPKCVKSFIYKSNLKAHMLSHIKSDTILDQSA